MPSKHKQSWRERIRATASPARVAELRAMEAHKRRKQRWRHRFAAIYGRRPEGERDEKILRKMLRGHPLTCHCYDCDWGVEECGEALPRVARVVG